MILIPVLMRGPVWSLVLAALSRLQGRWRA
jgi:hypothetical protein